VAITSAQTIAAARFATARPENDDDNVLVMVNPSLMDNSSRQSQFYAMRAALATRIW
jgi:hypothetical protein